jgi:hypothetical protein
MHILTSDLGLEWDLYFLMSGFDWSDLFDYILNWTSSQVKVDKKNDQMLKWLMTSIQLGHLKSSWTKQNDILDQDKHWCYNQMGHPMLLNRSK